MIQDDTPSTTNTSSQDPFCQSWLSKLSARERNLMGGYAAAIKAGYKKEAEFALQAEEYKELAATDKLTSLPNRKALVDDLTTKIGLLARRKMGMEKTRVIERPDPNRSSTEDVTLAFFDMNNFKYINDTFSHAAGDAALKQVATIAKEFFKRKTDTIGRLGGDEFLGVFPDTSPDQLQSKIAELQEIISKNPLYFTNTEGKTTTIPLSIAAGVYKLKSTDTVDRAIENASKAMKENKHAMKNASATLREKSRRASRGEERNPS